MTDDARLLLAACREKPEEDTPRLMLADEIQGEFPGAAAYLRESIDFNRRGGRGSGLAVKRRRQKMALDYIKWLRVALGVREELESRAMICGGENWDHFLWVAGERRRCDFYIRRGLPDAIRVTCPLLMERAAALNLFPLTRVVVSGRKPERVDLRFIPGDGIWFDWECRDYPQKFNTWEEDEEEIPLPLYQLLPKLSPNVGSYFRHADALGALNSAALTWVRCDGKPDTTTEKQESEPLGA